MKNLSMKKFTVVFIKVAVLSALIVQLAFASNELVSTSAYAEPLYLSLCGIILLAFGMLKSRTEEKDS